MRTIGGAFYETQYNLSDTLKDFIDAYRPGEEAFGPDKEPQFVRGQVYVGDEKKDFLSIEVDYADDGTCRVQVGKDPDDYILYIENGTMDDVFNGRTAIDEKSLNEIAASIFSEISILNDGGEIDLGKISFVEGGSDLPESLENIPGSHTLLNNDDLLRKAYVGDLIHSAYLDPVDPKGNNYNYPTAGIISPVLFEKYTGETFEGNRLIEDLKGKVPELGRFFGYDFLSEKPVKQTVTDDRDEVRMVFTVETYKENPFITERFSTGEGEDVPVRMSIISGTPMPRREDMAGILYSTIDVVFHDVEGRILADFKLDEIFTDEIFAEGNRLEYLNEYREKQLPDSYSLSVEKASGQLKGAIYQDIREKITVIDQKWPELRDTIRDLDVRAGKIALAYNFSAREWVSNKEKAEEQLSIAKGYKDGGETATDKERMEAVKTLKELIPVLSSSFEKYTYYKNEMIAATKETQQIVRYAGCRELVDPDSLKIDFTAGPCSYVEYPSFDLIAVPISKLPESYDTDMERYIREYNETAREKDKAEYNSETHCVIHGGEVLRGAIPSAILYTDVKDIVDIIFPDEHVLVDYNHEEDDTLLVEAVMRVIPEECKYNELFEDHSNFIGYQFSAENINILQMVVDTDLDKEDDRETIDKLNKVCFGASMDDSDSIFKDHKDDTEKSVDTVTMEEKYRSIIEERIKDAKAGVSNESPRDDVTYRLRSLENRRVGGVNIENEKNGIRLSKVREADLKIDSVKLAQSEYKKDGMEKSIARWENTDVSSLSKADRFDKIKADSAERWKNAKGDFLKVETAYKNAKAEYEKKESLYREGNITVVEFRSAQYNYDREKTNYDEAKDKFEQEKIGIRIDEAFAEKKETALGELRELWDSIKYRTEKMNDTAVHYSPILRNHSGYKWNDFMRGRDVRNWALLGGEIGKDSVITRRVRPLEIYSAFDSWTKTSIIGTLFSEALVDFIYYAVGYDYKPKYDYSSAPAVNDGGKASEKPDADEKAERWAANDLHGRNKTYVRNFEKEAPREYDTERVSRLRPGVTLSETDRESNKNGRDETVYRAEGKGAVINREETRHKDGTVSFSETISDRKSGNFKESIRGITLRDGTTRYENRYVEKNNTGIVTSKFGIEKPYNGGFIRYRVTEDKVTGRPNWDNPKWITGAAQKDGTVSEISKRIRETDGKRASIETTVYRTYPDGRRDKIITTVTGTDRRGDSKVEITNPSAGADKKDARITIERNLDNNGNGKITITGSGKERELSVERTKKDFRQWKVISGKVDGGTYERRISADGKSERLYRESGIERKDNVETGKFVIKETENGRTIRAEGSIEKKFSESGSLIERRLEYRESDSAAVIRTYNEKGELKSTLREFEAVRVDRNTETGKYITTETNDGKEMRMSGVYTKLFDDDGNLIQRSISYDDREKDVNVTKTFDAEGNIIREETSPIELRDEDEAADDREKADRDEEDRAKEDAIENETEYDKTDDDTDDDPYDRYELEDDEDERDWDNYDFDDNYEDEDDFDTEGIEFPDYYEDDSESDFYSMEGTEFSEEDETSSLDEGLEAGDGYIDFDSIPGEEIELDDTRYESGRDAEGRTKKDDDTELDAAASMTEPAASNEYEEQRLYQDRADYEVPGTSKDDLIEMFVKGDPEEKLQNLTDFLDGLKEYFADTTTTVGDIMDTVTQISHSLAEIVHGLEDDAAIKTVSDAVDTVPSLVPEEDLNDVVREKTGNDDFSIRDQIISEGNSYLDDMEKSGVTNDSPYEVRIHDLEEDLSSGEKLYDDIENIVSDSIEYAKNDIEQSFRNDMEAGEGDKVLREADEIERLTRESVEASQSTGIDAEGSRNVTESAESSMGREDVLPKDNEPDMSSFERGQGAADSDFESPASGTEADTGIEAEAAEGAEAGAAVDAEALLLL